MPGVLAPATADDVRGVIHDAGRRGETRLALRGGGSKSGIGTEAAATTLSLAGLSGIVDYDPPELVLTARAGTPLAEITALIEAHDQMLAFDPFDHGPIFGRPEGAATIGGIVAAGVAGPERLSGGSARDHLLGFEAVSGGGERFTGGARVVKNVTGYDLPKIVTGSWGRLVALTEVTLKVLPRPRLRVTLAIDGLSERQALAAMTLALGSQAGPAAAAHLPADPVESGGLTVLRLQGFPASVEARYAMLQGLLSRHGPIRRLDGEEDRALWSSIRSVSPLGRERPLWRIVVPAGRSGGVTASLAAPGARWMLDWGGGLVWLASEAPAAGIRAAAAAAGGHAMLVRGPASLRAATPALHPEPAGVRALSRRVRRGFDPGGIFETGRFLDDADAD